MTSLPQVVEIQNTAIPSIKSTISSMKDSIQAQLTTLQSQIATDTTAFGVLTSSVATQAQAVATLEQKIQSDEKASKISDTLVSHCYTLDIQVTKILSLRADRNLSSRAGSGGPCGAPRRDT